MTKEVFSLIKVLIICGTILYCVVTLSTSFMPKPTEVKVDTTKIDSLQKIVDSNTVALQHNKLTIDSLKNAKIVIHDRVNRLTSGELVAWSDSFARQRNLPAYSYIQRAGKAN